MNEENKVVELHSTNGRIQSLLNLGIHLHINRTNRGDFLRSSLYNLVQIMRNHPIFKGRVKYDSFSGQILFDDMDGKESRLEDHHISEIRYTAEDRWSVSFKDKDVWSAIDIVSRENQVNPLHDYLRDLRGLWTPKKGSESRAAKLLSLIGAEDNPLHRAYSRRWMLACVSRAYATLENRVKADYLLLLYGKQRIGKSTALREVAFSEQFGDRYFGDTALRIDDYRETVQKMQGKLIYELQEFAGRPRDPQYEKSFFSMQKDESRAVYRRSYTIVPRRTTFAVTTNRKDVLRDSTGSSRFWCVDCGVQKIDLPKLREELPYMWSETLHVYDMYHKAAKELKRRNKIKEMKK